MDVEKISFGPSGWVPNNGVLPVLFYRSIFLTEDGAHEFAKLFTSHGWEGVWHDGVFSYQHYHTQGHEVLGVGKGWARLLLGGPDGREFEVRAGDCVLLPAGTGHMNLGASEDFEVVGAYPKGHHADIKTDAPSKADLARIAELPLPETDPVQGAAGPMMDTWRRR